MADIQQTSRRYQYSLLTNTQTVMIMLTMTMLIRNPTHQIQEINFIHYKMKMAMILMYKVPAQTGDPIQENI
jgi:hypothetical protein